MSFDELKHLESDLATSEARIPNLRPDCAKEVVWADAPAVQTDLSIVYVHGFSATKHEIRPVPDQIATALGANVFYTRLDGHGQNGAAMGDATAAAWRDTTREALKIGRLIGKRVIVMGCSTGCPLLHDAVAENGADIAAILHVSPNFGIRHPMAKTLLRLPFVRRWGPIVMGRERSFDPISAAHRAYWTTKYPTKAVFAMDDAVRAAWRADAGAITMPTLMWFSEKDRVVDPKETHRMASKISGPVTLHSPILSAQDDVNSHVILGDVFSPNQTESAVAFMTDWLMGRLNPATR